MANGDNTFTSEMLSMMSSNRSSLTKDIATMVYYYNGGISYTEAWQMSTFERMIAVETVDKHFQKLTGKDRII